MPRGSKACKKCNTDNGPRSYFCKSCGEPFEIKGKKLPPEQKPFVEATTPSKLEALFELGEHPNPETNETCHEGKATVYESIARDGYFVLDQDNIYGIPVDNVKLCRHIIPSGPTSPNYYIVERFLSLVSAARHYVKIVREMKIKKSREQMLRERIDAKKNRKKA